MSGLLLVPTVFFGLSIAGAIVLFKWLDATALIKKQTWQAGGSLAGFLLIFGALHLTYTRVSPVDQLEKELETVKEENQELTARVEELQRALQVDYWTIDGTVQLEDSLLHDGVRVQLAPPPIEVTSDPAGQFILRRVPVPVGSRPELSLAKEEYISWFDLLDDNLAEVDPEHLRISLNEPIILARLPNETDARETPFLEPEAIEAELPPTPEPI